MILGTASGNGGGTASSGRTVSGTAISSSTTGAHGETSGGGGGPQAAGLSTGTGPHDGMCRCDWKGTWRDKETLGNDAPVALQHQTKEKISRTNLRKNEILNPKMSISLWLTIAPSGISSSVEVWITVGSTTAWEDTSVAAWITVGSTAVSVGTSKVFRWTNM